MDHPPESLTIRPTPSRWKELLRRNASDEAKRLRRELNLLTDRPIIMTGHQAEFWHPGILAKYLATDAASVALGAHPAWLFVDQDRPESVSLRYPARAASQLTVGTATVRERNLPTTEGLVEHLTPRMQLLLSTLQHHEFSPNLARRLALTLSDLVKPFTSLPHSTLFATELSRTSLFQKLVRKMYQDPADCISQYNAAAGRHPSAGIRPLITNDVQDRWELPLWHLPVNQPRRHVYAEDIPNIPIHELAPKALLMTGLMRLGACDLFIHGTGGGGSTGDDSAHEGYDVITEEWFERWLGIPSSDIAPMALVTATRYLPITTGPAPTAVDVAHALWLAHHARHDPALLHDQPAAAAKQHLLDQLALLPRRSRARHDTFRNLHALLNQTRTEHAAALNTLDDQARATARRFAERDIIFDRTWPFPLYPESVLAAMRDEVRAFFQTPSR